MTTTPAMSMGTRLMIVLASFLPDRDDVDQLIIGSFCSIGSGAAFLIMAGNQGHRYDWVSSFPFFYMNEEPAFAKSVDAFQRAGDTVIGSDVDGFGGHDHARDQDGHGAVIGSRALVAKDVEPYTIVGGNPAKSIRKRFSEEEISMLLDMAWWGLAAGTNQGSNAFSLFVWHCQPVRTGKAQAPNNTLHTDKLLAALLICR